MGKGNFFKKNIKKRKKERKERGIKQRISDQKKKVEEKVHHVVNDITAHQKPPEHEQEVKIEEEKETATCELSAAENVLKWQTEE